jgi:hypothetical protein
MRGKKGSAAANRRAEAADALVTELRCQLAELRDSLRKETVTKNAEIARLQGRLASEVDALSVATIAAVKAQCHEEVGVIRERYRENAWKALDILKRKNADILTLEEWSEVSALFDIAPGELFFTNNSVAHSNRYNRRMRRSDVNQVAAVSQEKIDMMDGLTRR